MDFCDSLRSLGLETRSVRCVHLLLRRCMDEAAYGYGPGRPGPL